jgi:NitT/TauT family transport system ATP-binding protein
MTVLFVTHSVTEAAFLANRIIVLSQRPARLLLDSAVALPDSRYNELRTSLEYVAEVRRFSAAVPMSEEAP